MGVIIVAIAIIINDDAREGAVTTHHVLDGR